jgi:GT2 family glycosyltransferase
MLSALVCTRDRPRLVGECLRSLAAAMPDGGEVVVVAYGDDSARDTVGGLGVDAQFHLAPRGGKSRQLNLGVAAAKNDVIVITDDDCRVEPDWLTAMAAPFSDPAVGATFGHVVGLSSVRGRPQSPVPPGPAPEESWAYANGAAMAIRRLAVLAIGGFDERLGPGAPLHGEEHDLVLRLQEAGWEVRIAAAPPVGHVEWRDEAETRHNLLVYSKGAGAFIGAALRRSPARWARTALRRCRYQAQLWRYHEAEGWTFGPATTWAFVRGLARGLLLRPLRLSGPRSSRSS